MRHAFRFSSSSPVAALVCSLSPERTIGGVHLRPAFRASVRRRPDVPVVRAVRGRRAAHGGAAGGHRRGLSPPDRDQARADRVPRPRGARRRRVRRRAVGAVARRAAHDGAPLGHAAARSRAGPRLRAAQSGIRVSSVVDWRSRDVAGKLDERLQGAEPVPEACGDWLYAPARAA